MSIFKKTTDLEKPANGKSQSKSALEEGVAYLRHTIKKRLEEHFEKKASSRQDEMPAFQLPDDDSPLSQFIKQNQLTKDEQVVLLLALVPHVEANFFERQVSKYLPDGGEFPEFGGTKGTNYRGMLPTAETALFVMAGNNLKERIRLQHWFRHDPFFNEDKMLTLEAVKVGEPPMSGRLLLNDELAEWLLTGAVSIPKLSTTFPAQYISTELEWSDIVLDPKTKLQIDELQHWLAHHNTLLYDWEMHKRIKPGYRALFYGPPGTGKTLTATMLGKYSNLPVFRVDLSLVVSKYIGETEKNLSSLFDKAEYKNWILFFDEADSLFSKRTNVRDAHDKYANQEVSYLLQRVENYPGLVILASNFKNNIDEAFARRFQAIIYFPMPDAKERLALWQKAFPPQVQLAADLDLEHVANQFELTGSNIMNVVQYCCIDLLAKGKNELTQAELLAGIKREYSKEDKVF